MTYEFTDDVRMVLEYNQQSATLSAKPKGSIDDTGIVFDRVLNKLRIVKLGLAMHF
jgi:hypothetical protein